MTSEQSRESPQRLSQSPPHANHYDATQDEPSHATRERPSSSGVDNTDDIIDEDTLPRAIFVGNFAHFARTTDIEQLFSTFGQVRRVDLKRNFAFVFMSSEQHGRDAITGLDGKTDSEIAPRPLKVEWARGDGAIKRREVERRRHAQTPSDTLFVVNFEPRSTTRQNLHDRFSPFGRVTRLDMQQRFAFVQFESVEQATAALKALHGSRIEDRHLIVEYTVRSTPPTRRGPAHRGPYGGAYGGGPPPPHSLASAYHHHPYPGPPPMRAPHSSYRHSRSHVDHQPSFSRYRPRHVHPSTIGSPPRRGPDSFEPSYSRRRSVSPVSRPRRESPDRFRERNVSRMERRRDSDQDQDAERVVPRMDKGRSSDYDQNTERERARDRDHDHVRQSEREHEDLHNRDGPSEVHNDDNRNDVLAREDLHQDNDPRDRSFSHDRSVSPYRSLSSPGINNRDGYRRQGKSHNDEDMSNDRNRGLHEGDTQNNEELGEGDTRRSRRRSYSRSPSPHRKRPRYEGTSQDDSPRYEPGGEVVS